jgi:cytochrome c biogenesis protein CcmG, thiol:disulfide interchange protein DsbE
VNQKTLLACALVFLLAPGLRGSDAVAQAVSAADGVQGRAANDFVRTDLKGRVVSLHAFRGKVVLLNFWATWCAPCLAEMPVFSAWPQDPALSGLQVVGASMDDEPDSAKRAVERLHLSYPVLMGDAALARSFGGVLGLPVTILIDRQGIVRKRYDGAADLVAMKQDIARLLK